jgi:hypothetical protein
MIRNANASHDNNVTVTAIVPTRNGGTVTTPLRFKLTFYVRLSTELFSEL